MWGVGRWAVLGLCVVWSCSGESETVRECQTQMKVFDRLRGETRRLIQARAQTVFKREVLNARGRDESTLSPRIREALETLRARGAELKAEDVDREEAALGDRVDRVFKAEGDVLVAEILIVEPERTVTLQYPENTPLPVVMKWAGLREHRLYCGLADCQVGQASQPCALIQLRPREHAGSAGLTVGFRRR